MGSHGMRQRTEEIDAIVAAADAVGQTVDRGWARGFHRALRASGWCLAPLLPAVTAAPAARTHTDPACPIHGSGG